MDLGARDLTKIERKSRWELCLLQMNKEGGGLEVFFISPLASLIHLDSPSSFISDLQLG